MTRACPEFFQRNSVTSHIGRVRAARAGTDVMIAGIDSALTAGKPGACEPSLYWR